MLQLVISQDKTGFLLFLSFLSPAFQVSTLLCFLDLWISLPLSLQRLTHFKTKWMKCKLNIFIVIWNMDAYVKNPFWINTIKSSIEQSIRSAVIILSYLFTARAVAALLHSSHLHAVIAFSETHVYIGNQILYQTTSK